MVGIIVYSSLVVFTFWYILQTRELKRFFQQEEAKKKEVKAISKEVDVSNVLNL